MRLIPPEILAATRLGMVTVQDCTGPRRYCQIAPVGTCTAGDRVRAFSPRSTVRPSTEIASVSDLPRTARSAGRERSGKPAAVHYAGAERDHRALTPALRLRVT